MLRVFNFLLLVCFVNAYNLESRLPLYKVGNEGSMFGFSVAMHKTSNSIRDFVSESVLVIGSPRAPALSTQANTVNPGGIYYCPVNRDENECTRVDMDNGPSTENGNKTNQWLGVTLAGQKQGEYLVTCAHRYASRIGSGTDERESVCGKCFLLDGSDISDIREVTSQEARNLRFEASPCIPSNYDKNKLAYTQVGTALAFNDGEYLLGGPGAYAWSGAMFGYRLSEPGNRGLVSQFATPGCEPGEFGRGSKKVKCDNIPVRRDSYLGFSVAASNSLIANSNETVYVVGAPRGDFVGAVVLYTKIGGSSSDLEIKDIIRSEDVGSSFGFSVAVTDLNGDNQDDLIVGAPQFYQNSDEGKYGGRIYIYISSRKPRISKIEPEIFNGLLGSYFGHSLAPLGDIDQDGFNDFAVGSPYDESGKVYIFRGAADGKVRFSQSLDGSKYVAIRPQMRGFGISLSSNVDIDNNLYPDLLVGTLQDQAILFRARPIISITSSLNVTKTVINVRKPDCEFGDRFSCFALDYCFEYTSRHSEYASSLPIKYEIMLDTNRREENKNARVAFSSPQGDSVRVEQTTIPRSDFPHCFRNQTVYFKPSSPDRLTPIDIFFGFSLVSDDTDVAPGEEVLHLINDPILDKDLPKEIKKQVKIFNDCGDDGCQSDLLVDGSVPPKIYVGENKVIMMKLNVSNDAEEAHQASLLIKLPDQVFYDGFKVSKASGAAISCLNRVQGNSSFIFCNLGNPYLRGSEDNLEITFDVSSIPQDTKEIVFEVTPSTTSTNPEIDTLFLRSQVYINLHLSLSGFGAPQQVRYSDAPIKGESAIVSTKEIGPLIGHTFFIKNEGNQSVSVVYLKVDYPIEINNGKWLLYLVSSRVTAGITEVGECSRDYEDVLNVLSPKTSASRRSKRFAEKDGKVSPLYQPTKVKTPYTTGAVQSTLNLNCAKGSARCVSITCRIDQIKSGTSVSVKLESRLWNATFLEEFKAVDLVHVGVFGKLDHVNENVRITGNQTAVFIDTTVDHVFFEEDVLPVFPWWYIVIGIIAALIIYIIIIYVLIVCGFFKRKRYPVREPPPDDTSDKDFLIEEETRNNEGRM